MTLYSIRWDKMYNHMNKQQLANRIWAVANRMRRKIDRNEYKDYLLGLIFYKFLSEEEVGAHQEETAEDIIKKATGQALAIIALRLQSHATC